MTALRIGTRGSPLALWQARAAGQAIEQAGGPACEPVVIRTAGDRLATRALAEIGGKRLFVKEIEEALLQGTVDLAVHSAKDLPAELPPGLTIGATLPRADPRDALALAARDAGAAGGARTGAASGLLAALGPAPRIGTGSVRRVAQLSRTLPAAAFAPVRGNVETRLRKLDAGEYDALVLAAAGMVRLGLAGRISARLPVDDCMPAPGQGIIAIEMRSDDRAAAAALAAAGDRDTMNAFAAERALVRGLGGDCRTPIGALAALDGAGLTLDAVVASPDGAQLVRRRERGKAADAAALGARLAQRLIADGAAEILAPCRNPHSPHPA